MRLSYFTSLFLVPAAFCAAVQVDVDKDDMPMEASKAIAPEQPSEIFYQLSKDVKTIAEEVVRRVNEGIATQAEKSGKEDAPRSISELVHNAFFTASVNNRAHGAPAQKDGKLLQAMPSKEEEPKPIKAANAENGRNEGLFGALGSMLGSLGAKIGNPIYGPVAALVGGEFGQVSTFLQGFNPFADLGTAIENLFANTPLSGLFSAISKLISVLNVILPIIKEIFNALLNNPSDVLSQATRSAALNTLKLTKVVVGPHRQLLPDDIYNASEVGWDTAKRLYPHLRVVFDFTHRMVHNFVKAVVNQDPSIVELLHTPTAEKVDSALQAVGRVLHI
ncbi:hypothetical protein EC973_006556 [Apophysomyces ossiformis]|uniref:Uncharacterized protein n=1 Tax=Apophysomyces ossiformis TaxID=679940 RepID=A0A8H7BQY6_9FUNG|nr:hypothetical protein EC973_006556 [Apophysomyces ossiformis]